MNYSPNRIATIPLDEYNVLRDHSLKYKALIKGGHVFELYDNFCTPTFSIITKSEAIKKIHESSGKEIREYKYNSEKRIRELTEVHDKTVKSMTDTIVKLRELKTPTLEAKKDTRTLWQRMMNK